MIYEIINHLNQLNYEIHGLIRGKSGKGFLVGSKQGTWDFGNKVSRSFVAVNYKKFDEEWITYIFSMSGRALASETVRKLTGDPQKFMLKSGLYRFRRMLQEDDTPGRKEKFTVVSNTSESEYLLDNSESLHREVQRVRQSILKKLWIDRYEGESSTSREIIEESACTLLNISQRVIETLISEKFLLVNDNGDLLSITNKGETEYLRIKDNVISELTSPINRKPTVMNIEFDAFISHASEDKVDFVRDLAVSLRNNGLAVWYDEFALNIGDSLRESIDHGLSTSRFGIVVLSHNFFSKSWPKKELNGLFKKMTSDRGRILPVWHKLSAEDVEAYSPLLSDLVAIKSSIGVDNVTAQLIQAINKFE
ncbi:MAG: TIR domain-containing protein [Planctomycetia bacterium]|nr:TIR domain-containing protein [Planctomycetia bacterium]